jgi:hypothetical protein
VAFHAESLLIVAVVIGAILSAVIGNGLAVGLDDEGASI